MLIDKIEKDYDICIIGSGPAGIAIALDLRNSGLKVLLAESGGWSEEGSFREEYSGALEYFDHEKKLLRTWTTYQRDSRMRHFGGTGNAWANYTRELDDIDFSTRSWVTHSGWPFGKDKIRPYYLKAYPLLRVSHIEEEGEFLTEIDSPLKISDRIETQIYHSNPDVTYFSKFYKEHLIAAEHVDIALQTHFLRFEMEGRSKVGTAIFDQKGKKIKVKANNFVLAMGGIENARMLLVQRQEIGVLGEASSLGRYFSEHTHFDIGRIELTDVAPHGLPLYDLSQIKHRSAVLALSSKTQLEEELLNGQIDIDPLPNSKNYFTGRIRYISEHAPNWDSQVELTDQKDRFGLPKTKIKFHSNLLEWKTICRFLEILQEDLGSRGVVTPFFKKDDVCFNQLINRVTMLANHHVGTTRMSESQMHGVVDSNCKVFGTENLYIAGSSVFSTSGHAAPTLTIVALSLRLSEELKLRCNPMKR